MGLNERSAQNTNFLRIKDHSLCFYSKTPVEGYEEITVTDMTKDIDPVTKQRPTMSKWIKRFASVDGLVTNIKWYDTEEKYNFRAMGIYITVKDAGDTFVLDLPFGTRPYDSFMKMMENIDYTKPVEISVWHNKKDDNTAFVIRQNGDTVKWKYTRENMGECPPPTQDDFKKWDFSAQKAWLYRRLMDDVIPMVKELNPDFNELEPEYSGADEAQMKELDETPAAIAETAGAPAPEAAPSAAPTPLVKRPEGHVKGCKCEPCLAVDKGNSDIPF